MKTIIKFIGKQFANASAIGKAVVLCIVFVVFGIVLSLLTDVASMKNELSYLGLAGVVVWITLIACIIYEVLAPYFKKEETTIE